MEYELRPSENFVIEALEKKKEHLVYAVINAVLLVVVLFIALKGYYPITCMVAGIVCLVNIFKCLKWHKADNSYITDLKGSYLKIDSNAFICSQTAENDSYEECDIDFKDIEKIVESTTNKGFYIYLKEDSLRSNIFVNNENISRNIFFVNGIGYNTRDFVDIYLNLIRETSKVNDITITGSRDQKAWYEKTKKEELFTLLKPWAFVIITGLVHVALFIIASY